jgi:hypothetical protein
MAKMDGPPEPMCRNGLVKDAREFSQLIQTSLASIAAKRLPADLSLIETT